MSNRLQKLSKEQAEIYLSQCKAFFKYQNVDRNEMVISCDLLEETILTLEHARKFITSRWIAMHPDGVKLYDECIEKLKETGFPKPSRKDGKKPCGECYISQGETCDICGASNA